MQVFNDIYPVDDAQRAGLIEKGPPGPIFMVNLLKFKERAEYEDGRPTQLTGREAYQIYGRAVSEILKTYGGFAVFVADVTFLTLGRVEELWDEVAIAAYPDRSAMLRMSTSKEWREAAVHRTAGLKGQLNIETVLPAGGTPIPWLRDLAAKVGSSS